MIDKATALEIAKHCRALANEVVSPGDSAHVAQNLELLADAIEANESVMSGIDIMRQVHRTIVVADPATSG